MHIGTMVIEVADLNFEPLRPLRPLRAPKASLSHCPCPLIFRAIALLMYLILQLNVVTFDILCKRNKMVLHLSQITNSHENSEPKSSP